MSKVTPMFPTLDDEHAAKYFKGVCGTCRRPIVRVESASQVRTSFFGKSLTADGVEHYVCTCPDKKAATKPESKSFFDAWLNSVQDLSTTLERAKLRHDLNEALPPNLKQFGDLLGMLVDPTGVAVEMSRKYWEKQAAEKRAAAQKPVKRPKGVPAPDRCHCSEFAGREPGRHHFVCAYNSKAQEAERGHHVRQNMPDVQRDIPPRARKRPTKKKTKKGKRR